MITFQSNIYVILSICFTPDEHPIYWFFFIKQGNYFTRKTIYKTLNTVFCVRWLETRHWDDVQHHLLTSLISLRSHISICFIDQLTRFQETLLYVYIALTTRTCSVLGDVFRSHVWDMWLSSNLTSCISFHRYQDFVLRNTFIFNAVTCICLTALILWVYQSM